MLNYFFRYFLKIRVEVTSWSLCWLHGNLTVTTTLQEVGCTSYLTNRYESALIYLTKKVNKNTSPKVELFL